MIRIILWRLLGMPFQALGVVTVVFGLVHSMPGDPAYQLAGPLATDAQVEAIRKSLGLSEPLYVQYWTYLSDLVHGDFGQSLYTGNSVITDLAQRAPATLELIGLSLIVIAVGGLLLAGVTASAGPGWRSRAVRAYGFLAGSVPDFWIGLTLIFLLYYKAQVGASPAGQLDSGDSVPHVTGAVALDALLTGQWGSLRDATSHLLLPMATLVFVYMAPVVRIVGSMGASVMRTQFIDFADSWGIRPRRRAYYALRQVMPTFVVSLASTCAFLLGGAVLIETVFSWGGLGQYSVQAVTHSDYAAIQGFVVVAGVFTVIVYTISDILQPLADPRLRRV